MTNKVNTRSKRRHQQRDSAENVPPSPSSAQEGSSNSNTSERDQMENSILDLERRIQKRRDQDRREDQRYFTELIAAMQENILKSQENLTRSLSPPNLSRVQSSSFGNLTPECLPSTSGQNDTGSANIEPNEIISISSNREVHDNWTVQTDPETQLY